MTRLSLPFMFSVAVLLVSCAQDELTEAQTEAETPSVSFRSTEPDETLFPIPDQSTALFSLDRSTGLSRCIAKMPDDFARAWDGTKATDAQYAEIGEAARELTADCENERQKFLAIYQWVTRNVSYDTGGKNPTQSAYVTFTKKYGNCQGYSNLVNTMCHAVGLAAFNANGYVTAAMLGHAWNYVKADGTWYVVDATNSRYWPMAQTTQYKSELFPNQIDVTLYEDDFFTYSWYGGALAVTEVKRCDGNALTVPYSIDGLRLFAFNPQKPLPAQVREVYLGSNITMLGDADDSNLLATRLKNVEAVHISSDNRVLRSEKGIAYKRKGQNVELLFIPPAAREVELVGLKSIAKNTIYNNNAIELLVIPSTVTRIEPYAVENAPNLRTIYVPEECVYLDFDANYNFVEFTSPTEHTFVGLHPDCQIIPGVPTTGIREVNY